MGTPKVSVVTPTYNHESLIGECIESVLAQTFVDWEMVIVDDGSKDATAAVVESFKDPRIKLVRQDNKGPERLAETYNAALAASSGELVAILEGDDMWPPDKLAAQVPDFDRPEVVFSWGLTRIVDSNGGDLGVTPPKLPPFAACVNDPVGTATRTMLHPDWLTFPFPVSVVMRRSVLESVGGFKQPPYVRYVDLSTFLEMGLQGQWAFHEQICGVWRRHGQSLTKSDLPNIFNGAYRLCAEFARQHAQSEISIDHRVELELAWNGFQGGRCVLTARMLAAEGRFEEARSFFRRAAQLRPVRKLARYKAISNYLAAAGRHLDALKVLQRAHRTHVLSDLLFNLAYASVRLKITPEWIYRLAGRPGWKRQFERDYDAIVSLSAKPEDYVDYEFLSLS